MRRKPVGFSGAREGIRTPDLLRSLAVGHLDQCSPTRPPTATGRVVIIADSIYIETFTDDDVDLVEDIYSNISMSLFELA